MSTARVLVRVDVVDANETNQLHAESFVDNIAALVPNGQRQLLTLANGHTSLAVPAGANGVLLIPVSGAFTYTLKGANGDTGVVLATTAVPLVPVLLPLGTAPTIVVDCTGAGTLDVVFF